VTHAFFLNFKYSRGDPHCKDFIILKNNKKNNTTVQRGSGDKRSQGATTKRLYRLYKQKQANKVKLARSVRRKSWGLVTLGMRAAEKKLSSSYLWVP